MLEIIVINLTFFIKKKYVLTVKLFKRNFKIARGHEGGDEQFAYNISPISNGSLPTLIFGGLSGNSETERRDVICAV